MTQDVKWKLTGDYFENCNCDVICPCLFSPTGPFTPNPTQGECDVAFAFHIDEGSYGDLSLNGLNAGLIAHTVGPMGGGDWKVALYIDDKGSKEQQEALQAIFSGAAGGPVGMLADFVGEVVGVSAVPIDYKKDGKKRAVSMGNVMKLAIEAIPSMKADGGEAWVSSGHPFAPDMLVLASGQQGSTYSDHGFNWDNSGKNGHYAAINWSN
jgi:hypothetical protein